MVQPKNSSVMLGFQKVPMLLQKTIRKKPSVKTVWRMQHSLSPSLSLYHSPSLSTTIMKAKLKVTLNHADSNTCSAL